MDQFFIPNLYAGFWYNNQKEIMEVYIHNKKSILLGMPRMRQVRIKRSEFEFTVNRKMKTIFTTISLRGTKSNATG